MTAWNANDYLRFGDERTRPAEDLASRIDVAGVSTAVDLGCGPGNSTQVIRRRWPCARVCGLDSSPSMIAAAGEAYPDQEWVLGDIAGWTSPEPLDLVFSNAALQWVPDHARLVRRLFDHVAPNGALAFQVPSADFAQVRALIHEIAAHAAWDHRMDAARSILTMEEPAVYYDALAPHARSIDMWETEYYHVLDAPAAIGDWISSTGLRPFLDALETDEDRGLFRSMLDVRIAETYERRGDGKVLYPFKRLFVIAYA